MGRGRPSHAVLQLASASQLTGAQLGQLDSAKGLPYTARSDFESALTHFPNHPAAIVGLSNILLDIYSEKLLPPSAIPGIALADVSLGTPLGSTTSVLAEGSVERFQENYRAPLPSQPLGLGKSKEKQQQQAKKSLLFRGGDDDDDEPELKNSADSELPPPYKAVSLPLVDRLAARDRAYGLLSGLTKLGTAWNSSEAWFALARAHEESGQPDKAKEVLWWCVELEEGMGVREWHCLGTGGYVL